MKYLRSKWFESKKQIEPWKILLNMVTPLDFTKRHLVENNKVHHREVLLNSSHSGVIFFGISSAELIETKRNLKLTWILTNEINNKIKSKSELPGNS